MFAHLLTCKLYMLSRTGCHGFGWRLDIFMDMSPFSNVTTLVPDIQKISTSSFSTHSSSYPSEETIFPLNILMAMALSISTSSLAPAFTLKRLSPPICYGKEVYISSRLQTSVNMMFPVLMKTNHTRLSSIVTSSTSHSLNLLTENALSLYVRCLGTLERSGI